MDGKVKDSRILSVVLQALSQKNAGNTDFVSYFSCRNRKGEYVTWADKENDFTLINFWAAYDAESRARNVKLWNEVNKLNASTCKVAMYSISFDEKTSVFEGTIKADKLDGTAQLHEGQGSRSDVFKKYRLERGLKNFLVNDEGIIIASNVSPEKLTELCKQI